MPGLDASIADKMQWLALERPHTLHLLNEFAEAVLQKYRQPDRRRCPPQPPASPRPDLTLTVDYATREYVGYTEHTPGSIVIPTYLMLHRRMGDVVPEVAELFERALWVAMKTQAPTSVTYELKGQARTADIIVRDGIATLSVRNKR